MDLLKTFEEYELVFVPRHQKILANGLVCTASSCQRPYDSKQFTVQVKYRPAVPDNEKYWQVFEGDKQIEDFLQSRNKIELPNSDSKYDKDCLNEEQPVEKEPPPITEINLLTREFEKQTKEYIN